jgi:hypothetical protein
MLRVRYRLPTAQIIKGEPSPDGVREDVNAALAARRQTLYCGDLKHDDWSTLSLQDVRGASSRSSGSNMDGIIDLDDEDEMHEDDRGQRPSK